LMFTKANGQLEWCGQSRLSAEMLAGSGRGPDPYAFLEAICWLEERLRDGLPVAGTVLREAAEEEGLTFPTLRRAKKALGVRSVKRDEQWDWQLRPLHPIPQPTPLLSLASRDTLEHLPHDQAVTMTSCEKHGLSVTPEMGEVPAGGGCGQTQPHAPADCQAQVVENTEEAREHQEEDTGETPPLKHEERPLYCPHCSVRVIWLLRGGISFCYKCKTPDLRARRHNG
jgi:hypothetical protein